MVKRPMLLVFALLLGLLSGSAAAEGVLFQHPLKALPHAVSRVFAQARSLRGFYSGPSGAPRLLVFFDPDCPFCAHFWQHFHRLHTPFRVFWVPVAYVRPSSLGRAAALLQATHPARALTFNESHFHFHQHLGGLMPAYTVPAALQAAIRRNTRFWHRELGFLPCFFYQGRQGAHLMLGTPNAFQWRQIAAHAQTVWPTP